MEIRDNEKIPYWCTAHSRFSEGLSAGEQGQLDNRAMQWLRDLFWQVEFSFNVHARTHTRQAAGISHSQCQCQRNGVVITCGSDRKGSCGGWLVAVVFVRCGFDRN